MHKSVIDLRRLMCNSNNLALPCLAFKWLDEADVLGKAFCMHIKIFIAQYF